MDIHFASGWLKWVDSISFNQPLKMFRFLLVLLSITSVVAYLSTSNRARSSSKLSAASSDRSIALPFLKRPEKLDGTLVGDFGFDPLGFTENVNDLDYVQSAEIKHGRVAMLATVGFIVQQYVHFLTPEANPVKAAVVLGNPVNLQILAGIGIIELATWGQTFDGETPGKHSINEI